ncbi:transmembrane protein, putative (macronuclear) [Tetrahymena thermophila SB210]|uniref:Transmembrane protein, putative n=1 Tax=Tetrahymena thermophila (strain SB210) TaxID=312017 RepID=W7XL35_TETTS|nr:transmembrane protein, putative [Tetrahymena thermophila SB210]EWS75599.1 transmembrane protein, putative [Tetrahymena thermophila SB210]|eukprot:XP_012651899.1 transmembrane protein, putative [Tetrahymena thermophila SB210]
MFREDYKIFYIQYIHSLQIFKSFIQLISIYFQISFCFVYKNKQIITLDYKQQQKFCKYQQKRSYINRNIKQCQPKLKHNQQNLLILFTILTYQLKLTTFQLRYQSSFDELKLGIENLEKQVERYLAQDSNSCDQTKSQFNLNYHYNLLLYNILNIYQFRKHIRYFKHNYYLIKQMKIKLYKFQTIYLSLYHSNLVQFQINYQQNYQENQSFNSKEWLIYDMFVMFLLYQLFIYQINQKKQINKPKLILNISIFLEKKNVIKTFQFFSL